MTCGEYLRPDWLDIKVGTEGQTGCKVNGEWSMVNGEWSKGMLFYTRSLTFGDFFISYFLFLFFISLL
jgi:hypothetical protein